VGRSGAGGCWTYVTNRPHVQLPQGPPRAVPAKGEDMGKEARVALLLAGTACLLAAMVEWVVSELQ
jgi:hypothetical protein